MAATLTLNESDGMEESKRKRIEAQLRQMLRRLDETEREPAPVARINEGARVIRRRRGEPDRSIA